MLSLLPRRKYYSDDKNISFLVSRIVCVESKIFEEEKKKEEFWGVIVY